MKSYFIKKTRFMYIKNKYNDKPSRIVSMETNPNLRKVNNIV